MCNLRQVKAIRLVSGNQQSTTERAELNSRGQQGDSDDIVMDQMRQNSTSVDVDGKSSVKKVCP